MSSDVSETRESGMPDGPAERAGAPRGREPGENTERATRLARAGDWSRRAPLLPALIFVIVLTQLPFIATLVVSFMNWNAYYPDERGFAGFDNFARVFTEEVGEPPAGYVERVRIEAARRQLEQCDDTVGAIAARCGFGTPETLRRSFIRRLGVSPDQYRRTFA